MGHAASRYNQTDWDTADGKLSNAECICASYPPTEKKTTITLTKTGLSDRVFEVTDAQGWVLFKTATLHETEGRHHLRWFDLLGKSGDKIARVEVENSSGLQNWNIFSFGKPSYTGHQEDKEATKVAGEPMYKIAAVVINSNRDTSEVHIYKDPLQTHTVLMVEEVKHLFPQFQSFLPNPKKPLVGYWKWNKNVVNHHVELELAKGVDMPLHVILVVLTNIVHRSL